MEDLQMESVAIDESQDLYWELPFKVAHDVSKPPNDDFSVGKLSDDCDLIRNVCRGEGGDISYNFVHVWPLLRYIAETVKK